MQHLGEVSFYIVYDLEETQWCNWTQRKVLNVAILIQCITNFCSSYFDALSLRRPNSSLLDYAFENLNTSWIYCSPFKKNCCPPAKNLAPFTEIVERGRTEFAKTATSTKRLNIFRLQDKYLNREQEVQSNSDILAIQSGKQDDTRLLELSSS